MSPHEEAGIHTITFGFVQPAQFYVDYSRFSWVPKGLRRSNLWGSVVWDFFLQARCPLHHPTNRVKELKEQPECWIKADPQFFCDQLASGDNTKPNSKLPSYSTAITFQSARRCQTASLWSTREYKMTTFVKNHTGCQPWLRPLWRMSCHTQSSRSAFHSSRRWRPDISSGHGSIAALSLYCPCHLATPANQTNTACCILKNNTTFCILWSEKKTLMHWHQTFDAKEWCP